MWLSPKVFSILEVSKDSVDALRRDLAATVAERDLLKSQLLVTQNTNSWLCTKVTQLEYERASLIEKVHGIKTAVPEIVTRQPAALNAQETMLGSLNFEHVDEDTAKRLGISHLLSTQ